MKFKGKNIEMNDKVIVTQKYVEEAHLLPLDRIHIGWVSEMQDIAGTKLMFITHRKLVNPEKYLKKLNKINGFWNNLVLIPKFIGLSNFSKGQYFEENSVGSIEVLK